MRVPAAGKYRPALHKRSALSLRGRPAELSLGAVEDELTWLGAGERRLATVEAFPTAPASTHSPRLRIGGRVAQIFKRTIDLGLLLMGALPALFVTLIAAVLVAAVDRQRPFYADRRVGRHGEPFWCLKLRTMKCPPGLLERYLAGSPEEALLYERERKLLKDPRITGLGRWLRKLSIDELPQLWNVARGDMSFVGPRPLSQREFDARPARDRMLLAVARPGLTCLWQVSGRNDVALNDRLALDREYVEHWSPFLELRTILATPLALVGGRGAR